MTAFFLYLSFSLSIILIIKEKLRDDIGNTHTGEAKNRERKSKHHNIIGSHTYIHVKCITHIHTYICAA